MVADEVLKLGMEKTVTLKNKAAGFFWSFDGSPLYSTWLFHGMIEFTYGGFDLI